MVKLFNSIMSFQAILPVMNALVVSSTASNIGAHLTCVGSQRSSSVLLVVVIVKASFWVMHRLIKNTEFFRTVASLR